MLVALGVVHHLSDFRFRNLAREHSNDRNPLTMDGQHDLHGLIMINAEKQGITPEELIAKSRAEHEADFQDFGIAEGLGHEPRRTQLFGQFAVLLLAARGQHQNRQIGQIPIFA